jgi:hypothetical protein
MPRPSGTSANRTPSPQLVFSSALSGALLLLIAIASPVLTASVGDLTAEVNLLDAPQTFSCDKTELAACPLCCWWCAPLRRARALRFTSVHFNAEWRIHRADSVDPIDVRCEAIFWREPRAGIDDLVRADQALLESIAKSIARVAHGDRCSEAARAQSSG